MSDRPILFNAESIPAILAGKKTQTRRIMKPQPWQLKSQAPGGSWAWSPDKKFVGCDVELITSKAVHAVWCAQYGSITMPELSPYGLPGDMLWVKEGYQITEVTPPLGTIRGRYLSDGAPFKVQLTDAEMAKVLSRTRRLRATPGRFMYKSLARIRTPVVSIRVERVQDITPGDCEAEGITGETKGTPSGGDSIVPYSEYSNGRDGLLWGTPREAFESLWDSIHGHGAWERNDWTWVVEFEEVGK